MRIENQVCSLELAKKLKELGMKQESLFWFAQDKSFSRVNRKWKIIDEGIALGKTGHLGYKNDSFVDTEHYSAFTSAELGKKFSDKYKITLSKYNNKICVGLWELDKKWGKECLIKNFEADTEADGRALAVIYLVENNLLEIPK